jgi:hypothetical protein
VSERTTKHAKPHRKPHKDVKTVAKEYPVEVLVYDPIQKEKVVASYSGESRWWFSTRMFKVYHPAFAGGSRWVLKLGRILGQYDPTKEFPTAHGLEVEARVVKRLMSGAGKTKVVNPNSILCFQFAQV